MTLVHAIALRHHLLKTDIYLYQNIFHDYTYIHDVIHFLRLLLWLFWILIEGLEPRSVIILRAQQRRALALDQTVLIVWHRGEVVFFPTSPRQSFHTHAQGTDAHAVGVRACSLHCVMRSKLRVGRQGVQMIGWKHKRNFLECSRTHLSFCGLRG